MKRIHLIVSGDVQGVGFRAWTKQQARVLSLTGWVKNREDGAVEIVAEGNRAALEALIEQAKKGPEVAWVHHVDIQWEEVLGEFVAFEVLY